MTSEEKQEYLLEYGKYRLRSKRFMEQINEIRILKTCFCSVPLVPGSDSDWLECMQKCDTLECQITEKYRHAVKMCLEVQQQIEKMKVERETEKMILVCRYIKGDTWEKVADGVGYSLTNIHRLHKKALEHFEPV